MKAGKFDLEFIKKERIADRTFEFYFKRPKNLKFESGQYLKVTLPIKNPDNRGSSRHFTISSSHKALDHLRITTEIVESTFKLELARLKKGHIVNVFGPIGYFTFHAKNKRPKLFLATGMGITPYFSVLQSLDAQKNLPEITLIVSFSKKNEVIYFKELQGIQKRNSKIKVIYSLTKEKNIPEFENGRISKELIKKYAPDYKKYEIFIVGSQTFEYELLKLIKSMGVEQKNIFSENFPGY